METRKRRKFIISGFILMVVISVFLPQGLLSPYQIPKTHAAGNASAIKLKQQSVVVSVGKTYQLTLQGTSKKPDWKSSNISIATVSKTGTVKGIKDGTVTITAILGSKEYSCQVTVQDIIVWKDPAVEAIVRQALGKETGDITKKEAAGYCNWLILYRDDIKTIEDLVWFKNMTMLVVRADLLQDAGILPSDLQIRVFFNGIRNISDIANLCNFDEINKFKHQGVIINQRAEDSYVLGTESVNLEYENDIEDFTGIDVLLKFKHLEYLDLSSNALTDLSFLNCLADVKSLMQLVLGYNNISDITIIKKFKNLHELYLQNNLIEDVAPLSNLKYLERISLIGNKLTDISPLGKLYSLATIELSYNNIEDISALKSLNPSFVDLKSNKIVKVNCFDKMSRLDYVDLSMNNISNVSGLKNLHSTATLILLGNQITDWSPVSHIKNVLGRTE